MSHLLGAWLAGLVVVGFVAAENFWIVDRLLATSLNPSFHKDVGFLAAGEARAMLRYLVSEQNRFYFVWWGWAEVAFGVALLVISLRVRERGLIIKVAILLALTAIMQFYLTPRIVDVGRTLDFVPREPAPPQMATMIASVGWLHAAYSTLDLVKLGVGICLGWSLIQGKLRGKNPPSNS